MMQFIESCIIVSLCPPPNLECFWNVQLKHNMAKKLGGCMDEKPGKYV